MTETLSGRHIVVTGGTGALGGAVVGKLLEQGAICHVPNAHAAAPGHFPFTTHERVMLAHNVDLSDSAKVEAFYRQVPELWASIHLAGGFTMAPVEKIESASFAEMMDTNARTVFLCSRAAVRSMLAPGTAGRIVNLSSALASLSLHSDPVFEFHDFKFPAYDASKTALNAWTVHLAHELRDTPIKVNAVDPGSVRTDMSEHGGLDVATGASGSVRMALLDGDGPSGSFTHLGEVLPW